MRINLQVPFLEKDIAKKHGAKWDSDKETWYVIDPTDIMLFIQWAPERLKQATTSEPLVHPEHVVVQPRTPRFKKKRRVY